ncbi:hypothetical protein L1987_48067 [Smallanthus sonchifolius]|uniref:Uncharacterized protein n=1 Tax=Smallanthus sonchifolius TaxID=185202 RepID=A0ACB9FQS2_9ASTR|nr:hypothetical protein L1987_48067 [Smallanthus sonchifolius]
MRSLTILHSVSSHRLCFPSISKPSSNSITAAAAAAAASVTGPSSRRHRRCYHLCLCNFFNRITKPRTENISKHSIVSLSTVISKVKFSAPGFSKSLQKFLRSDCFVPWNKLGILYKEEKANFDKEPNELKEIWRKYMEYGFTSSSLVGICLVFPRVLNGDSEVEALVSDLKRVVVDFDLINDVDGEVDTWIDLCRKIRLFYNLGCKKHDIFDLIGRSKTILVEYSEVVLSEKIEYLCRFDVTVDEVISLLVSGFKNFDFELRTQVFCVTGLIRHFGMDEQHLNVIMEKYPYVFGKNRLANLPHVMRALSLNQWFFDNLKNGGHRLLESYPIINSDQDYDKDFAESLVRIQSSRVPIHTWSKLQFLHSIEFGENGLSIKFCKHKKLVILTDSSLSTKVETCGCGTFVNTVRYTMGVRSYFAHHLVPQMGIKIEILGFLALWWHACCICLTRKRDTCQRYEATIASAYPRVWDMMDRTSILGDAIEHLKELAHNVCRRNSEYTHVFLLCTPCFPSSAMRTLTESLRYYSNRLDTMCRISVACPVVIFFHIKNT